MQEAGCCSRVKDARDAECGSGFAVTEKPQGLASRGPRLSKQRAALRNPKGLASVPHLRTHAVPPRAASRPRAPALRAEPDHEADYEADNKPRACRELGASLIQPQGCTTSLPQGTHVREIGRAGDRGTPGGAESERCFRSFCAAATLKRRRACVCVGGVGGVAFDFRSRDRRDDVNWRI